MEYLTYSVNESPVLLMEAGAALSDVRGRAVKFDANGHVILAAAGEDAIGIALLSNEESIPVGGDVHVQYKDIGYVKAGAALSAGDCLVSDANGAFTAAVSGAYIAIALESAAEGAFPQAIITHGYKAAS